MNRPKSYNRVMIQYTMQQTKLRPAEQAQHIATLYHDIRKKCQAFDIACAVTDVAARKFRESPTENPFADDLIPNLLNSKKEIDCLLASFGAQTANYLYHAKGRVDSLAKTIYPNSETDRSKFNRALTDTVGKIDPGLFNFYETAFINLQPK